HKKLGPKIFSETMNRNKFAEIILRIIYFDKKNERIQRLQTDKFALVSEISETTIIVDEQLFPTKAKCKYTQYITNQTS
ncbi:piggyBac transposable element-derived protein 4-like, partial [Vespula maculifrons]